MIYIIMVGYGIISACHSHIYLSQGSGRRCGYGQWVGPRKCLLREGMYRLRLGFAKTRSFLARQYAIVSLSLVHRSFHTFLWLIGRSAKSSVAWRNGEVAGDENCDRRVLLETQPTTGASPLWKIAKSVRG